MDPLKTELVQLLEYYVRRAPGSRRAVAARFYDLLATGTDPFSRMNWLGHVTVSGLVTNPQRDKLLLVHHKKLGIWLQPGGHVERDLDDSLLEGAAREVREETGLEDFLPLSPELFDVDIHEIPARRDAPAHLHYDLRFLFEAHTTSRLALSVESTDIRWFTTEEVYRFRLDASQQWLATQLDLMARRTVVPAYQLAG